MSLFVEITRRVFLGKRMTTLSLEFAILGARLRLQVCVFLFVIRACNCLVIVNIAH